MRRNADRSYRSGFELFVGLFVIISIVVGDGDKIGGENGIDFAISGSDSSDSGLKYEQVGEDELFPDFPSVTNLNKRIATRVRTWGFQLKTYQVETEDGYILKLHRLYKHKDHLKAPVLFMHGINGCSANYLVYRPSLAFFLAERGYDVWVGNARGTALSMKHRDMRRRMSYKKKQYWKFSFHEMGHFDLPAFLRAIHQRRPNEQVHYVGYSMGTTMFLVLASTRHEYLPLIASVSLLGPVARPQHFDLLKENTIRPFYMLYFKIVNFMGHGNIFKYRKSISSAMYSICKSEGKAGKLCEWLLKALSVGTDIFDFKNSLETFIFFPCGTSIRAYQHFLQLANAGKFQQFDHGKRLNKKMYKSKKPPEYDLASIDKTIYLLVGGQDKRADKEDVEWLHDKLVDPKYIGAELELFDHRDFEYSIEIDKSHNTVLRIIEGHEKGTEANGNLDIVCRRKWPWELGVVKSYLNGKPPKTSESESSSSDKHQKKH